MLAVGQVECNPPTLPPAKEGKFLERNKKQKQQTTKKSNCFIFLKYVWVFAFFDCGSTLIVDSF